MSYQPEERYWTDYLRIALPVVGLLLMLGLFWYWATNVIGNDGSSNKPAPTAQVSIVNPPTVTATTAPVIQLTPPLNVTATAPANTGALATESNANSAGANPTSAPGNTTAAQGNTSGASNSSGGSTNPSKFKKGDTVQTSSDQVNMRQDHSVTSTAIEPMATGTQLSVTGPGVKDGDYIWIPVTDPATQNSGWVADSLVQLVPAQ